MLKVNVYSKLSHITVMSIVQLTISVNTDVEHGKKGSGQCKMSVRDLLIVYKVQKRILQSHFLLRHF